MPWASFSMLDGPGGTGCDVPVRGCWVSRDVIVAAVYNCVKECMGFVMYLIITILVRQVDPSKHDIQNIYNYSHNHL